MLQRFIRFSEFAEFTEFNKCSTPFGKNSNCLQSPACVFSGVDTDVDMSMEIVNRDTRTETFEFHSAIAVSKDKTTVYACIAIRFVFHSYIKNMFLVSTKRYNLRVVLRDFVGVEFCCRVKLFMPVVSVALYRGIRFNLKASM